MTFAPVLLILRIGATRVVVLGRISVGERKSPRRRWVVLVFSGWNALRIVRAIGSSAASSAQR